jgi:hypothetical protein
VFLVFSIRRLFKAPGKQDGWMVGFRFGLLALALGYWLLVGFRFGLLTLALGYWLSVGFSGLLFHPV